MSIRELNVRDAAQKLDHFRVIDVREPHEFEEVHIDRAQNVPLGRLGADATGWSRDQPILVVCRSGGRSGRGASELTQLGFRDVTNLTGGMLAWEQNRLPVIRIG